MTGGRRPLRAWRFGPLCLAMAAGLPTMAPGQAAGDEPGHDPDSLRGALELLGGRDTVAGLPDAAVVIIAAAQGGVWTTTYHTDRGNVAGGAEIVVPVGVVFELSVTASDTIHEFAFPRLGFSLTAIPGRIEGVFVTVHAPGTYAADCIGTCPPEDGTAPPTIRAIAADDFALWLEERGAPAQN